MVFTFGLGHGIRGRSLSTHSIYQDLCFSLPPNFYPSSSYMHLEVQNKSMDLTLGLFFVFVVYEAGDICRHPLLQAKQRTRKEAD